LLVIIFKDRIKQIYLPKPLQIKQVNNSFWWLLWSEWTCYAIWSTRCTKLYMFILLVIT